jgi:hypothetical protein
MPLACAEEQDRAGCSRMLFGKNLTGLVRKPQANSHDQSYDRTGNGSRSTRSSELRFEDGQIRLTGAGRGVPYPVQETCVHQATASPDTPSEFVPFPVNLIMPDHIRHPEAGN